MSALEELQFSSTLDCEEEMGMFTSKPATLAGEEHEQETAAPPKKRARISKPRPEGRPYKRASKELLLDKIAKMKKQESVLQSRLVLLLDRLEKHTTELKLRDQEAV